MDVDYLNKLKEARMAREKAGMEKYQLICTQISNKLREERMAREKARMEKLRKLNIKKYAKEQSGKEESKKNSMPNLSKVNKPAKSEVNLKTNSTGTANNNFHVNETTKRPGYKEFPKPKTGVIQPKPFGNGQISRIPIAASASNITKTRASNLTNAMNTDRKLYAPITENIGKKVMHVSHLPKVEKKVNSSIAVNGEKKLHFPIRKPESVITNLKLRENLAVTNATPKPNVGRKSMNPQSATKSTPQFSVFECPFKPRAHVSDAENFHNVSSCWKKARDIFLNNRHTNPKITVPAYRSISAVHSERKGILGNYIHKLSPIVDNEDENIKADKVISAVKSERKKVSNFYTPRPEEQQARLKSWLLKRAKSVDTYHHLQRFGLHHLPHTIKFDLKEENDEDNKENIVVVVSDSDDDSYTENMNEVVPKDTYHHLQRFGLHHLPHTIKFDHKVENDEDNKENIVVVVSDSDDDSYTENMNEVVPKDTYHHLQRFGLHHLPHTIKFDHKVENDEENKANGVVVELDNDDDSYTNNMNEVVPNVTEKWRTAVSDSAVTSMTASDVNEDIFLGNLKDLIELLQEGVDWKQCARWLRAIRERYPGVLKYFEYWQCRAVLDDRRGDLPASVQCREEAIVKGIEQSVAEPCLDYLFGRFMQLKISPTSGNYRQVDPKRRDIKNVYKSTIIQFSVQTVKLPQLKQSNDITPIRRRRKRSLQRQKRTGF